MSKPVAISAVLIFAVLLTSATLLDFNSYAEEEEETQFWPSLTMVYETGGRLVSVGSNPTIHTREVHRLEYRSANDWKDTVLEATVVQYDFGEESTVGSYQQTKNNEYTVYSSIYDSYRREEIGENEIRLAGMFMYQYIPAVETTTALVCYWDGCANEFNDLRYHREDAREMVSLGGRWLGGRWPIPW